MTTWVTPADAGRKVEMVLYGNGDVGLRVQTAYRQLCNLRLNDEQWETLRDNVEGVQGVRESLASEEVNHG